MFFHFLSLSLCLCSVLTLDRQSCKCNDYLQVRTVGRVLPSLQASPPFRIRFNLRNLARRLSCSLLYGQLSVSFDLLSRSTPTEALRPQLTKTKNRFLSVSPFDFLLLLPTFERVPACPSNRIDLPSYPYPRITVHLRRLPCIEEA